MKMKSPLLAGALLALSSLLAAQSPLTTIFASNNGLSAGGAVFFDLQVNVPITINAFDLNVSTVNPGTLTVYVLPGATHRGNEQNAALWLQVGTGSYTGAGLNLPTPCTLAAPFGLPVGTHGICLMHTSNGPRYTNGTASNLVYTNTELTLTAGTSQGTLFTAAPILSRVVNCSIHYTLGGSASFGIATQYGTGCVARAVSFYQEFPATTFDLANSSILLTDTGTGWTVTTGTAGFFTHTVPGLALGDDTLSAALTLPFTMTYPGGSTNTIRVCSNGFIWLNGTATLTDFSPTPAELLTLGPRLAPLWFDMVCDGTANLANAYYEADPTNNVAYVTWLNVPEYLQTGSSNTFQVVLRPGSVEYRYLAAGPLGGVGIVGSSPGAGNRNGGSIDISASLPFVTAPDQFPLVLAASARPVLGSTINLNTSNIVAGSTSGVYLMNVVATNPGIDLTAIGMPGCSLYAQPLVTLPMSITGATGTLALTIPTNNFLIGLSLFFQAAVLSPTVTPLGIVSSNGLELKIGSS